jgi:hypothetical protein
MKHFLFGRDCEPIFLGLRPAFIGMLELVVGSNSIPWLSGLGGLRELFLISGYLGFADLVEEDSRMGREDP